MSKSQKKILLPVVILVWIIAILAVLCVCAVAFVNYCRKPMTEKDYSKKVRFEVPGGTSVREVCSQLQEQKLIRSGNVFYLLIRAGLIEKGKSFNLKSGVYNLESSMSLEEIYNQLQSGRQEYISVRIPEGLTKSKIAAILEEDGVCSAEEFKRACEDENILNEYNIPAQNMEGFLFPDTYFLVTGMSGSDVVHVMADNFFERVRTVKGFENLTNSDAEMKKLYRTIVLASIVEREYRVESEAPLISSVFTNRLKYNIGLYSCATIEYILTEIQGKPHPDRITYDDLKIDSPYNTYMYAGLTPGPISNPGLVAINAAANPAKTDYYYFVLTDPVKGSHTFSETFDQHKAAENINYYSKKSSGSK